MQILERDLFRKGKKSLLAAVRGVLLLCAFVSTPQLKADVVERHNVLINPGQTVLWGCDALTGAGSSEFVAGGVRYVLNVYERTDPDQPEESATICVGDTILWRCQFITTAGPHGDTVKYALFPEEDSLRYKLNVTVNMCYAEPKDSDEYMTICAGESELWHGQTVNAAIEYKDTLKTVDQQADSIRFALHVIVRALTPDAVEQVIVKAGEPASWHGGSYGDPGEYTLREQYPTAPFCDSIEYRLRVVLYDSTSLKACDGDTVLWRCQPLAADSIYKDTVRITSRFTGEEVDSIIYVLNFSYYTAEVDSTEELSIAPSALPSFEWRGKTPTEEEDGIYVLKDTIYHSGTQCIDSVYILNLTVACPDSIVKPVEEIILPTGDSHPWVDNNNYTTPGEYAYQTKFTNGCDSILYRLRIVRYDSTELKTCYGDTVLWRCQPLAADSIYKDTVRITSRFTGEEVDSIIYVLNFSYYTAEADSTEELSIAPSALPSFEWRGKTPTEEEDGIYVLKDTIYHSGTQCIDSVYILNLTVACPDSIVKPVEEIILPTGDSHPWVDNNNYTTPGEYAYQTKFTNGCDSILYRLRIVRYDSTELKTCYGDTILWRCQPLGVEGVYKDTMRITSRFTGEEVDSIIYVLNFSYYTAEVDSTEELSIAPSALPSFEWRGKTPTEEEDGIYVLKDTIYHSGTQCIDSVYILNLTVACPDSTVKPVEVILLPTDSSYTWVDNNTYTEPGEYAYQTKFTDGCDSILYRLRIVRYDSTVYESCGGDTVLWRCQLLTQNNLYADTLRTISRFTGEEVDSIIYVLNYHRFLAQVDSVQDLILSESDLPFTWRDSTITVVGVYELHDTIYYENSTCIDSTYTLNLSVLKLDSVIRYDTLCYGDTLLWMCEKLDSTGVYSDTLYYTSGHDSLYIREYLTVYKPLPAELTEVELCNGDSVQWIDGLWYKESIDTALQTYYEFGCDSVLYQLKITTHAVLDSAFTDTVCYAPKYIWRNKEWDIPTQDIGNLTYTFMDTVHYAGTTDCDSVRYKMDVTVLRAEQQVTDTTVCEQDLMDFRWKPFESEPTEYSGFVGDSVMTATAHYKPVGNHTEACDSVIHTLRLHVLRVLKDTIYTDVTICYNDPYEWYGETYSETGRYEHTIKWPQSDCDSAYCALRLTVRALPDTVSDAITRCADAQPYMWHGQTIDHGGEYWDSTFYEGTECVNRYFLLEVEELTKTYDTVYATFCSNSPYHWQYMQEDLTAEGWYVVNIPYASFNECDSVVHCLYLTEMQVVDSVETVYICNGDTYMWFDTIRTKAGTYYHTDTAANGCDSIHYTLHLEKQAPLTIRKDTMYICGTGQVVWNFNHVTYNHGGLYYDTIRTVQGCDSLAGELLVVEQQAVFADVEVVTISDGDVYPWHGGTYSQPGEYTAVDTFRSGCDSVFYTLQLSLKPVTKEIRNITDTVCKGTDYLNTGHVINAHTEWTDSVRQRDQSNDLVDYITNYAIDVYTFDFPDGMLESAEIACGQAPKITAVVQSIHAYLDSSDDFAPNCQLNWFISENNGIWQPLDTMQALNGNDSIVTLRCVMTSDCGTISKEASFQVGHKVYPESFTEYDFLPVIRKFEGTMLMLDVNDICSRFGWTNCAPQLSTDAGYTANGLYPDQVRWYRQVGQVDNLSHPDPNDPKDVNMQAYGYYYRPSTEDSYYAIIEHELTVAVSDCNAWARTVSISGSGSNVGDLQPNVVNGQQRTAVQVKGVTSCDITVSNSMGSIVISLQNVPGSFVAPTTPGTYFVVIRDLTSGAVFNRTLLVY